MAGISITFTQTEKNFSAAGRTNAEGVFVLIAQNGRAGALPGKNKVTLTVPKPENTGVVDFSNAEVAEKMMKSRGAGMQGGKKGAPTAEKESTEIPPEYSNTDKSPLEYDVKPGSNEFDIPIP